MEIKTLLKEVCRRGRESVKEKEKGSHRRGALRGFELAEKIESVAELERLIVDSNRAANAFMQNYHNKETDSNLEVYWEQRYCSLQLEFVYEVLNVGLRLKPTASARAIRVYADIVGVKEQ